LLGRNRPVRVLSTYFHLEGLEIHLHSDNAFRVWYLIKYVLTIFYLLIKEVLGDFKFTKCAVFFVERSGFDPEERRNMFSKP
jgi:hypothetical protein